MKNSLFLKIIYVQIFIVGLFISFDFANAATYYMSGSGLDNCTNLHDCFDLMSGSDTLIIRDGIYVGEENTIVSGHYPPSGTEGNYTIIKTENNGGVVFDGEGIRSLINLTGNGMPIQPSYLQFEGLTFTNSSGYLAGFIYTNHIKIIQCYFYETDNADEKYSDSLYFRYTDYMLVEDCVIWGNGRYHYLVLDSNNVILRRCVDRFDRGFAVGYSNLGSFRIYSSSNVLLQNCITIDGDQENYYLQHSESGAVPATPKSYWPAGANGPTDNVHILGSIALNNRGMSMYILSDNYTPDNNTIENSVFWGGAQGLWSRSQKEESALFNHLTVGEIGAGGEYSGIRGEYGYSVIAKNNILANCGESSSDYATAWTDTASGSTDYNLFYNNTHNYNTSHGAHPQPHDICLENNNELNPFENSLKYLPRIEPNSDLSGAASDGGDIGANILYKIGRDGTLWGEEGYNEITNESLWPFPNEDIIKEKMAEYIYDDGSGGDPEISGERGFCADGNGLYGGPITLTSYIWEYLGNSCPLEICNYENLDTTPPSAPQGLAVS